MRVSKEEWIKRRAEQLWQAEEHRPDREQACWDKAVQEYEAGTSEADRSQVQPGPDIGTGSDPTKVD
ncbi:hypothetical protein [Mesorhizobium sp. SP-1A]|uniref:hypothetical protein n=1 Tax=Mesorhizobium sp. SP-1A TaxID=3077840 RepID=UPI0028F6F713|nr:hypothetical protein [Mesorhizobium sp. SP-1A]